MLVLFTQNFRHLAFSFGRESADLEGLCFRQRKFNFTKSFSLGTADLLFFNLEVILFSLEMTLSPW